MSEILDENLPAYDVIKLPHHGSYLKNYEEILNAISFSHAVITDSEKNPADQELIRLLEEKDLPVHRTSYGVASFTSDGKQMQAR